MSWPIILPGGYAVLAAVLAVWSTRVCLHPSTKPAVRAVAYKIFRTAWTTGVGSGTVSLTASAIKLHESGFL